MLPASKVGAGGWGGGGGMMMYIVGFIICRLQAFRGKGIRLSRVELALCMRTALSSLTCLNQARSEDRIVRSGGVATTQVVDAGSGKHSRCIVSANFRVVEG